MDSDSDALASLEGSSNNYAGRKIAHVLGGGVLEEQSTWGEVPSVAGHLGLAYPHLYQILPTGSHCHLTCILMVQGHVWE